MTGSHDGVGDLAPKEELEKQLRETILKYQLVIKATNDVLYDLNLETGKVTWNEGLFTQYGHPIDEETSGMKWWAQHVHPDDALRVENEIDSWFVSGVETMQLEYRFLKADGKYVDVRDRGIVQRDAEGTPIHVIGSMLDITRQKQLDHAKDEFISLVSHQLRTPLTAIRLYSEMLDNGLFGELEERQKEPVNHISDAAIRLINLVGNILDISKVELGHVVSNPIPVKINRLIRQYINEVMPLAVNKDVKIRFKKDDSIDTVLIDTMMFGQVIHNLLTNSIRYTRHSKGRIEVVFSQSTDGYLLSVKDNGIGIPESAKEDIFNRFYRAQNAKDHEEQGTGLGLYMIKLMVEASGCDVWFESEKDNGTIFFVHLPPGGMKPR